MPPKRKATAKKAAPKPAKLAKKDSVKANLEAAAEALKGKKQQRKNRKVDTHVHLSGVEVYEDYDCMLNQTNIGNNNNKYYVIQLLHNPSNDTYYVWNRFVDFFIPTHFFEFSNYFLLLTSFFSFVKNYS